MLAGHLLDDTWVLLHHGRRILKRASRATRCSTRRYEQQKNRQREIEVRSNRKTDTHTGHSRAFQRHEKRHEQKCEKSSVGGCSVFRSSVTLAEQLIVDEDELTLLEETLALREELTSLTSYARSQSGKTVDR